MTVKIRLARFGCKNRPFYRVVAADDKSRRDGKQIEVLGFYDPLQGKDEANRVSLKFDRIKYWLSLGAQPTDSVENMLFRAGLIPPKSMVVVGSKNGQKSTNHHVSPITVMRTTNFSGLNIPRAGLEYVNPENRQNRISSSQLVHDFVA